MEVFKKDLKQLLNGLKGSAKKRGIPFNLTIIDLYNLTFPITCPILKIPLAFNSGKAQDNSYSIDRIDSSKGYEPDNIVVISQKANRLKSNATLEEMKSIVDFYSELIVD